MNPLDVQIEFCIDEYKKLCKSFEDICLNPIKSLRHEKALREYFITKLEILYGKEYTEIESKWRESIRNRKTNQ